MCCTLLHAQKIIHFFYSPPLAPPPPKLFFKSDAHIQKAFISYIIKPQKSFSYLKKL